MTFDIDNNVVETWILDKINHEMLFFRKKITVYGLLCVYLQRKYNVE